MGSECAGTTQHYGSVSQPSPHPTLTQQRLWKHQNHSQNREKMTAGDEASYSFYEVAPMLVTSLTGRHTRYHPTWQRRKWWHREFMWLPTSSGSLASGPELSPSWVSRVFCVSGILIRDQQKEPKSWKLLSCCLPRLQALPIIFHVLQMWSFPLSQEESSGLCPTLPLK